MLISVIIPVYNVEKYLERCINSIINQTYRMLEVILVDDGSTDNSGNICDMYAEKDSRIRAYHIKNGGPAKARNYGIDRSTGGGYITFVDSDDWIEPFMYEKLLSFALEYKTDITGCATMTDYANGESKNTFEKRKSGILSGKSCILDILYQTQYAWGAMYNKLYKKDLFQNIRFPEIYNLEDYVVSTRLYNEVDKIYFCDLPMYHYTIRQGSLSKNGFSEKKLQVIDTAESIKKYFIDSNASIDILKGANSFVFRMYVDIFWQIFKCKPLKWKRIVKSRRKNSINALVMFLKNADKHKGDGKRLLKYFIVVISSLI